MHAREPLKRQSATEPISYSRHCCPFRLSVCQHRLTLFSSARLRLSLARARAGNCRTRIAPPEELATSAATAEKKRPRVRKRAIVRRKAPTSLSAAKAVAISAPLPDYPYQAKHAHITGSGVCVMLVNRRSGRVTSAMMMAQSTGNAILDKMTTDTFAEWRFKPRTVSQVQVPITYR